MEKFVYQMPTKIVFGRGAELQTADCVQELGLGRVLIVYGGSSARRSGLLDRIEKNLDEAGIAHAEIGGVQPNPRLSLVREGIRAAIAARAQTR